MSQALYAIASKIESGKLQTETGYFPILGIIVPMTVLYWVTAPTGLARMEGCEAQKNNASTKKYIETSLIVATVIPAVLLMQKIIQKDIAAYMMLYGIAGAVTAGLMTDVLKKCQGNETEKTYNGFYLTGFAVVFLLGLLAFFFIR